MSFTNKQLVAYATAQLGKPYWWGTFGQVADASLYNQKKKQYPGEYQWTDMKSQYGKRVHDCVGLIKGAFWSNMNPNGVPKYQSNNVPDTTAGGMRTICDKTGKISSIPNTEGVLVFRNNSHIGIYLGNGYVIEAKGHRYGVVKTKLADGGWTDWGKIKPSIMTYVSTPAVKPTPAAKPTMKVSDVNAKKWVNGSTSEAMYRKLDKTEKFKTIGARKSGWCYAIIDGKYLIRTSTFLNNTEVGFVEYAGKVSKFNAPSFPWKNGSTVEPVYSSLTDCQKRKNSIGTIYVNESAVCYGAMGGCYIVVYTSGKTKKVGWVKYAGGVK